MANGNGKKYNKKAPSMTTLFVPELRALLSEKKFSEVKPLLSHIPSVDIAERWHNFSDQEKILIFKLFSFRLAVEVFEALKFEDQSFLLNNLDNADVVQVLNEMSPDERANLFKDLPQKVMKKFFKLMKKEEVEDVRELMTYAEGTAGALMTTDYVELKREMSARSAILKLQDSLSFDNDFDIGSIYVTDNEHRLLGVVGLQDLIKAPQDMLLKDIMENADFIKINDQAPDEEVAQVFKRYDLTNAPVINAKDELSGVITIDDIVDIIDREATKEIYEVGKMTAGEGEVISYATATVKELVQRRAGWLIFLLMFDFLTGTVLKTFQDTLSTVVSLVFFIPMLLDTGGNAGAQSSITVIRGLATGDVSFNNVKRVVKLELFAALFMGVIVGGMAFIRAVLLQSDPLVALVVGVTMFLIVLLAIATGITLPLLSKKFGLDPAVLAGPITTSVVDVIGLILYFKVAQLFLPILR
ncbi:MAG: magnesium transporter [Candidatus Omnitrophica bacterium]|nr:magnesium transporter [Candidatus Omnitrophota bacterium]